MKLSSSFVLATFVLVGGLVCGGSAAPTGKRDSTDPIDRLTQLRAQLERYESSILHAFFARAAFGGSVENEPRLTQQVFDDLDHSRLPVVADAHLARFLGTHDGAPFSASKPYPPFLAYETPVVLPADAVLDKPVVGKGIFPTGRRPQDPTTILTFFEASLQQLPRDASLDPTVAALLDAALLELVSARIALGYQVALAKFDNNAMNYCSFMHNGPHSSEAQQQILGDLTDHKQEVNVLGRVQEKAAAYAQVFRQGSPYPAHAKDDALRLFQAYIIPITKQLELETIINQANRCKHSAWIEQ